jgi:hypothetical protein
VVSLPIRAWRAATRVELPVNEDRATWILGRIHERARSERAEPTARHACQVCARLAGADGVGLVLARSVDAYELGYSTDPWADEMEELQVALGQGPGIDATGSGMPVLVDELAAVGWRRRWPAFSAEGLLRGVAAMFSLPLGVGAARLGALDLYRRASGPLTGTPLRDAMLCASIAFGLLVDGRAGVRGARPEFDESLVRPEVHQAAGMVSAQLDISLPDALVRLRAHAYAGGQRLIEVARAVVARQLRFTIMDDGPGGGPSGESTQ